MCIKFNQIIQLQITQNLIKIVLIRLCHQNFDPFFLSPRLSNTASSFLSRLRMIFFSNKAFKKFKIELHTPSPPI